MKHIFMIIAVAYFHEKLQVCDNLHLHTLFIYLKNTSNIYVESIKNGKRNKNE